MPKFTVRFPNAVTYLPDHPKGRRIVTELEVSAPDATRALVHAIRVVTGDVGTPLVEGGVGSPTSALSTEAPYQPAIEVS